MKRVFALFFGLVLLSQVLKFYEQGQGATVKRQPPARVQPVKPEPGATTVKFMLTAVEEGGGKAKV